MGAASSVVVAVLVAGVGSGLRAGHPWHLPEGDQL
jgi:hypothetical protein